MDLSTTTQDRGQEAVLLHGTDIDVTAKPDTSRVFRKPEFNLKLSSEP